MSILQCELGGLSARFGGQSFRIDRRSGRFWSNYPYSGDSWENDPAEAESMPAKRRVCSTGRPPGAPLRRSIPQGRRCLFAGQAVILVDSPIWILKPRLFHLPAGKIAQILW